MKNILLGVCLLLSGCSTFLFYPTKEYVTDLSLIGIPVRDIRLETPDNIRLNAWFVPAFDPKTKTETPPKGTILFLHGNAENISTHILGVLWLSFEGYNIFALDYRGFGQSQGSPSLSGAETDIQTALGWLIKHQTGDIFVLGQSIGGALTLSAINKSPDKDKVSALVIDSAFSGTRKIAREKIGASILFWAFQYPISWTVAENDPLKHAKQLTVPKLFITTETDNVVPASHTLRLYEQAAEPKKIIIVPHGKHIQAFSDPTARLAVLDFLEQNAKAPN